MSAAELCRDWPLFFEYRQREAERQSNQAENEQAQRTFK